MSAEPAKSVAVVGASSDHRKFGNKCVRAHQAAGWRVFPVNLQESEIEGLPVYRTVGEAPAPIDRVALYLPPRKTLRVLAEIAAAGPGEVIFNPGSWDAAVVAEADRLGLPHRRDCAIVALGMSPSQFP